MLTRASAPPAQLASASRPPRVPTRLRCTSWGPLWPRIPSQCDQDILDDEFGHRPASTTSPLLLHKAVVPRRKKQQPDTLTRLLATVHAHFPPRPTVPLLEPLFDPDSSLAAVPVPLPIQGLPREDEPFIIHRTAEIARPKDDSPVRVEKPRLDIRQGPHALPKPPGLPISDLSSPSAISFSPLTFKESTPAKAQKPLDLSYLSLDRYPFTPNTPRTIWDSDEEDSDSD